MCSRCHDDGYKPYFEIMERAALRAEQRAMLRTEWAERLRAGARVEARTRPAAAPKPIRRPAFTVAHRSRQVRLYQGWRSRLLREAW